MTWHENAMTRKNPKNRNPKTVSWDSKVSTAYEAFAYADSGTAWDVTHCLLLMGCSLGRCHGLRRQKKMAHV